MKRYQYIYTDWANSVPCSFFDAGDFNNDSEAMLHANHLLQMGNGYDTTDIIVLREVSADDDEGRAYVGTATRSKSIEPKPADYTVTIKADLDTTELEAKINALREIFNKPSEAMWLPYKQREVEYCQFYFKDGNIYDAKDPDTPVGKIGETITHTRRCY
jgi:hypothetical protein